MYLIMWIGYVLLSIMILVIGSNFVFKKTSVKQLSQVGNQKIMEFDGGFNSELVLALQMANSPLVQKFFINPTPEITALAVEEIGGYQKRFLGKSSFWISETDLKFYSNLEYAYTVDINNPDNYWWKMTVDSKEDYNFNINYNPALNQTNLWVNACVRNPQGRGIGIVGTGIPLDGFLNSMFKGLDSSVSMTLFNKEMEITGCTDSSVVAKKLKLENYIPGLKNHKVDYGKVSVYSNGGTLYYFVPIKSINWMIVLSQNFNFSTFFNYIAMPLVIVIILGIILAAFQLTRQIFIPLRLLKKSIDEISSGNGDLTQRIEVEKLSSIKLLNDLCISFNAFMERLQVIISSVKKSKGALVNAGSQLGECTEDTVSSISEIINGISSLGATIQDQVYCVENTTTSVDDISHSITKLDNLVQEQNASVRSASNAVGEMVQRINSVNKAVENLSQRFTLLENNSAEGVKVQQEVDLEIKEIQSQSVMLQEANSAIAGIAEQTNLLAMNAAIEAAHAGEAGKGFSVVADEIRKLSETSASQSKTISEQLETIKQSIEDIVNSSSKSSQAFTSVSEGIHETSSIVQEIAVNMQEQAEGSALISESLEKVTVSSSGVNDSSKEMFEKSNAILTGVKTLTSQSDQMKDRMGTMSSGAEKINSAGMSLQQLSSELGKSIYQIGSQIDEFKV